MPESLEKIAADVITPSAATSSNVPNNALKNACDSKTELNKLKKEQQQKKQQLKKDQETLEKELKSTKNALSTEKTKDGNFAQRQWRDKNNERKGLESKVKTLEAQLQLKKQEIKDYKSSSKESLKEKEEAHKANVNAALDYVNSEKNLHAANPIAANQAAYIGDGNLFKQVNKSARTDQKAKSDNTALHAAVLGGNQAIILKLAEKGADFDAQNAEGKTPIHLAAMNPNYHSQSWGEWAKGENASNRDFDNIKDIIPVMSPALDILDKQGKTALHYAAENGDQQTVEALIKAGANPNIQDAQGKTALDYVPTENTEVKQAIEKGIQSYADELYNIATIEVQRAERDAAETTLKKSQEDLSKTKERIKETDKQIKETKSTLANIEKKQGYIAQIEGLNQQKETAPKVNGRKVTETKENLTSTLQTQKENLASAQAEVANRKKEIRDTEQELKKIKKKTGIDSVINQTQAVNSESKEDSLNVSDDDFNTEKGGESSVTENDKNALKTTESQADLEAKLTKLTGESTLEGSLKQAEEELTKATAAIALTEKQLAAIKEAEKIQTQITALEAKRDAINIDVSDANPQTLDGKKTKLERESSELTTKLVNAKKAQKELEGKIKDQTKDLAKKTAEIDRIEKIINDAGLKPEEFASRALSATIATKKDSETNEQKAARKKRINALIPTPITEDVLKKYNVADISGRTPLSYAMEKGVKIEAISAPLQQAYEDAKKKHDNTKGDLDALLNADRSTKEGGITEEDVTEQKILFKESQKELAAAIKAFNPADNNGKTPLDYAIDAGNKEGAALFGHTEAHLKAGNAKGSEDFIVDDNKDAQNINGQTPLHIAAKAANKDMVNELIRAGANLTIKDINGNTPLHVAAEVGNTEVMVALVTAKTELLNEKGKDEKTPIEIAIEKGNVEALEAIKKIYGDSLTDEQLANAKKKREELEKKQQEDEAAKKNDGLTPEEKAAMANSAPLRDSQQSNSTGQNSQDLIGETWKEEDIKKENGVSTARIGDPNKGHFIQTRTPDGKFEYKVNNTAGDDPDRIQVLKVPRDGSNPKSFDIVKFNKEGNIVFYEEGKGGTSKIGPDTTAKINEHVASLSQAQVSEEKLAPTPSVKKKDPMEIPPFNPTAMKQKHNPTATMITASSSPMGNSSKSKGGFHEI